MPTIGPLELGIILLIVLLIFGPKAIPQIGKAIGQGLSEFKKASKPGDKTNEQPEQEKNGES